MMVKAKKKICFFTGTRAEYGLLRPLMELVKKEKIFHLQTLVSGSHLSKDFGLTYKEILKDGFSISAKVDIDLSVDTSIGLSRSFGLGVAGYAKAYARLQPDEVVILGDRYEALAASIAAVISGIPIVHIHGGEATFGAIDESFRHAISKMSSLHFVTAEDYRHRVIQLGEHPGTVFTVGALGLDNIRTLKLFSKAETEKTLGFCFQKKNLLVTFHPVTRERGSAKKQMFEIIRALDALPDTFLIFTKANADIEGRVINQIIDAYVRRHSDRSAAFVSLGQQRYLSVMKYVDAVVGNSSSGIIEAPSFRIGTINVGDRQEGRIQSSSVINCPAEFNAIRQAIQKLYSKTFQESLKNCLNPYGRGSASKKIVQVLKRFPAVNLKKKFYDISWRESYDR